MSLPVVEPSVSQDARIEALVALAHKRDLAHSIQWLRLGHYRQGLLGPGFLGGGYTSQADGAGFFLSPRGKTDPQAELDATIRAFFLEPRTFTAKKGETRDDAHPVCRFPGRLLFLRKELGLDPSHFGLTCPAFSRFYESLNPQSVTLIFSSYFLNNPASAFGHTFLRINKAGTLAVGKRRELLDFGVDYSADVGGENALVYAIKGLSGLFNGTFKQTPYYYKVRQYNDAESRDLWEYEVALQPEQIVLLVAHLWELGHTHFDYFYLSENCSYQILALIEAVEPKVELTSRLHSPVLPTDTVKVLASTPGLVREVRYRPSLRTQFRARVHGMSDEERDLVEELSTDAHTALPSGMPNERRIAVFDAAADLIDVLAGEDLMTKSDLPAAKRKQRVLERRAEILMPSEPLEVQPPKAKAPEAGHGSLRLALGGAAAHGMVAPSIDLRLNMHDLADPSNGFPDLNAIEFIRARVQLWPDGKVEADDIAVFRVTSLTAQDHFDRQMSWKFDVGAQTLDDSACARCFAAHVGGGAGVTFAPWGEQFAFFLTGDIDTYFAPDLDGIADAPWRVGVGPFGGFRLRITPSLVTLLTGQYIFLPWQDPKGVYKADAVVRWEYIRNFAVSLEARALPNGYEGQLLQMFYF